MLSIIRELERLSDSAARSLEEGLEETLTVHSLGLPEKLRRSFSSTNIIESAYSRSRHVMRNVKRWTTHGQKCRWVATALMQAEKSFRRIKGHSEMALLDAALRKYLSRPYESKKAA